MKFLGKTHSEKQCGLIITLDCIAYNSIMCKQLIYAIFTIGSTNSKNAHMKFVFSLNFMEKPKSTWNLVEATKVISNGGGGGRSNKGHMVDLWVEESH